MAAPKGNQFWKLRSKHGKDAIFETPKIMLEAAYEYMQWCEDNPLMAVEYRGASPPVKVELPKMRAMTMQGLCSFLHVNTQYFRQFKDECNKKDTAKSKDYSLVITHIEEIVYNQKFTGAAAGFLNANIIARDLGLSEMIKQETTSTPTLKVEIVPGAKPVNSESEIDLTRNT